MSRSRTGEQGVLVMCDMNHFKSINDTYGHMAGDRVLKEVANCLQKHCRKSDYVARLSGDEFTVLMPSTPPDRVPAVVGKLNKVLNMLVVRWGQHEIPVSASIGYENYTGNSTSNKLLHLADKAMYHNKGKFHDKGNPLVSQSSNNTYIERRSL